MTNNAGYKDTLRAYVGYYAAHQLVVLPIRFRSKEAIVPEWQNKSREELLAEFYYLLDSRSDLNIAIRLDYLIVIDVEKLELLHVFTNMSLEELAKRTWVQRTGRGLHVLFRGRAEPFRVDGLAEIRSGPQQYIVVAPSIHPETLRPYQWLSDITKTPIANISDDDLVRLRAKLEALKRFQTFITQMTECWKRYHRHSLALWLSGVLRKLDIRIDEAETILKTITALAHDEEAADRLRCLRDTFEKDAEEVKAWSGLREELVAIVGPEEAEHILSLLPKPRPEIRLEAREGEVFVFNDDELVMTVRLRDLSHASTKTYIAKVLGLPLREVEKMVASFLYNHKNNKRVNNDDVEESKPQFDPETEQKIEEEVRRIQEAENQLEAFSPHLDNVIVGETINKKVALICLAGSKFIDPKMKLIVVVKGSAGGGKTTLASTLARLFKTKEVGRFTTHALEYTDLKGYDVLYIKEFGSMDLETQGVATIKFISSEDEGFVVEYPVRDEVTGRFVTEQKRIPPITVISTTTRLLLEEQFERRTWFLNVDESQEQTRRILEWKAKNEKQEAEKALGLRRVTDYEFSCEVLRRFIEQLKPVTIIIPFPKTIAEALASDKLRVRGDLSKIYTFVKLYALFNLKRLYKLKDEVYAVTPEVALEALQLLVPILSWSISGADSRVMPLIEELKTRRYVAGDKIDKGIRDELAVKLKKSERTVRAWLELLEERGYVSSQEGERRTKIYTLLYNPEKIEAEISESSAILKIADDLGVKMAKEAQNELFCRLENGTPTDGRSESKANIDEGGDGSQALEDNNTDIKAYRSDTPSAEGCVSNQEKSPNRASFVKRSSNLRHFGEFPIVSNDSHDGSDHSHGGTDGSTQASSLAVEDRGGGRLGGIEAARKLLEEQVQSLPPEFKAFVADFEVDRWGYANIRCRCGANFGCIDDFESHVRAGACRARRCSCGDTWTTLSELVEHAKRTGCTIDPSPPPDPPERKTRRRWRRLHGNGDLVLGGDE